MNVFRAAAMAGVSSIVLGCATAHPIAPIDTSTAVYRDPSFRAADLKESGIAVLPMTADGPADVSRAVRVGPRLALAIENRHVCALVMRPADVKERLVRDGVSERFLTMLAELPKREELDRATLDAMAASTGCRYFLQASVRSGNSYEVAPGYEHGSRAVTSDVFGQLWDAATGEVVWEGSGGGAALTNPPHGGTTDQVLEIAIDGLAGRLGMDPDFQPPRGNLQELHDLEQAQIASVERENAARADAAVTGLNILVSVVQLASAIADIAN